MDTYIRKYDGVLEPENCQKLIREFEVISETGEVIDNKREYGGDGRIRDDKALFFDAVQPAAHAELTSKLMKSFNAYISEFPGLGSIKMSSPFTKVQRTIPGGGYHTWHSEWGKEAPMRVLTWILYLNGVEGGETEFLNQHLRISPEAGRLVIFPAYFPWQHRGNPPLSGVKYIATGWCVNSA